MDKIKLSLILLMLTISLTDLSAQINRSILGVKLGMTKESELSRILPKGRLVKNPPTRGGKEYYTFELGSTEFAGIYWTKVTFSYDKKNTVCYVNFERRFGAISYDYLDLAHALRKKYKDYEFESVEPGFSLFSDGQTAIILEATQTTLSLTYKLDKNEAYFYKRLGYLKSDINEHEL